MTQYHSLAASTRDDRSPGLFTHLAERMLEGPHRWGSVDVSPAGRTTWNRTRLSVYPPGTSHSERRALRFWHTWPVMGAIVALFTLLALSAWPPFAATSAALAIYGGGVAMAYRSTKRLRPLVRVVTIVTVHAGGGAETVGDVEFYTIATNEFRALDSLSAYGLLTPSEYEASWALIYNAMPARA